MATENANLIQFLNQAIDKLSIDGAYQWGHSGACNCGHLAQVMTGESKGDLLKYSQVREGDWTEQAEKYCETSGLDIDRVIRVMLENGLSIDDINHIEYLSNPSILQKLPNGHQHLERNQKQNVIMYFQAWVTLLEEFDRQGRPWKQKRKQDKAEVIIYDSIPEDVMS